MDPTQQSLIIINQSFFQKNKKLIISAILILLLTLMTLIIVLIINKGEISLFNPLTTTNCQPEIPRTANRKTGMVAIENQDKNLKNIVLFRLGEKNIIKKQSYNVSSADYYLRGGRVLNFDLKNKFLIIDAGDNHTMKIQLKNQQNIRMRKKMIKYGSLVQNSYIDNIKACSILKDDIIGIILNDKDLKEYNKIIQVSALELVQ
ncbi:hypothetical protein HYU93_03180 [Candidatus Daviesbacteria bacterium]|nr:hypothetical protein [Candidatus Daviesbacteria bacterium]